MSVNRAAVRVQVWGLVQGVGFRPFVHRLAQRYGITGWVRNDGIGATIHVEGGESVIKTFCMSLMEEAASPIRIDGIKLEPACDQENRSFRIDGNGQALHEPAHVRVPPDRATCAECLREVFRPWDRRFEYAFTTCTSCGPRYSIIESLPYERPRTTMRHFPLCSRCTEEYTQPKDRRFHAEPIACSQCGPRLIFFEATTPDVSQRIAKEAIQAAARCLASGNILALKGLGGFQLLVRADQSSAVKRLRERKHRPTKPLAVMASSAAVIESWTSLTNREKEVLESAENPIVVVKVPRELVPLSDEIAPGLDHVGIFLPTTPLHHLLLAHLDFPVVVTSGNRSDEPILTDETQWRELSELTDACLVHDRPIHRRVDDSVVRVVDESPILLRLARGHAPLPLPALERWAIQQGPLSPVLATGGQQKVAPSLWNGRQAILSAHIGDVDEAATRQAFRAAAAALPELYVCEPAVIACDLHPDYFTTRWAEGQGLPRVAVQHHHAHAVACMVEHDLLDQTVLALTWDGTGFGPDGTIWGGEILRARLEGYERLASLMPFALPGGEAAIREPERIALALLSSAYGDDGIPGTLLHRLGYTRARSEAILQLVRRGVKAPQCSTVGRLFDGVAAMLIPDRRVSYEGETGAILEAIVDPNVADAYPLPCTLDDERFVRGDWRPMIRSMTRDVESGLAASICAARFHNALAQWAGAVVGPFTETEVVLGGGCFQNAWLIRKVRNALERLNRRVYVPSQIPPGDGGLSVGQLAIALGRIAAGRVAELRST